MKFWAFDYRLSMLFVICLGDHLVAYTYSHLPPYKSFVHVVFVHASLSSRHNAATTKHRDSL